MLLGFGLSIYYILIFPLKCAYTAHILKILIGEAPHVGGGLHTAALYGSD